MRSSFYYDLQAVACSIVFVLDTYLCMLGDGPSPGWGFVVHTLLMGWIICIAFKVARSAVKLRIQDFLAFGLAVTVACIAYFAVIYRYMLVIDGSAALVTADRLPLDSLPYATGHYTLYFSVMTFLSVGYGDLQPQTPGMMLIASVEALAGYAMTVLLITAGLERIRGIRWGGGFGHRR